MQALLGAMLLSLFVVSRNETLSQAFFVLLVPIGMGVVFAAFAGSTLLASAASAVYVCFVWDRKIEPETPLILPVTTAAAMSAGAGEASDVSEPLVVQAEK